MIEERWIDTKTSVGREAREIKDDLPSMVMSGWFNKYEAQKLHVMFNNGDIAGFLHEWRTLYREVKLYPRCSVVLSYDSERGERTSETLGFHPKWDAKTYKQRVTVRKWAVYTYGVDLDKVELRKTSSSSHKNSNLSSGELSEIYQPFVDEREIERKLWGKEKNPQSYSKFGRKVSTPTNKLYWKVCSLYNSEDLPYQPNCRVVSFDTNDLLTMSSDELLEEIPHKTILNHFLDNDAVNYQPFDEYQTLEIDNFWKEVDEEESKVLNFNRGYRVGWGDVNGQSKLECFQEEILEKEVYFGY